MESTTNPDEVRINLQYLRDHKVCETLEQITKALLVEKPQQPVDTILRVLRNSTPRGILTVGSQLQRRSSPSAGTTTLTVTHVTSKHLSSLSGGAPAAAPLLRDESLTSETSAFSIHSVDMGEFLLEFRQAYTALSHTRTLQGSITRHDLLDLLDIVAIPTPDTRMLESMFSDIDVNKTGKVPWDTFLARINYKIQGKYHNDVIRMIFTAVSVSGKATWVHLKNGMDKLGIMRTDDEISQVLKVCGACGADGEARSCILTVHDFGRIVQSCTGQSAANDDYE